MIEFCIISGFVFWESCGIIAAGFLNANLRAHYPNQDVLYTAEDHSFSLFLGLLGGPIGLIGSLICSGFGASGWTLARKPHLVARRF